MVFLAGFASVFGEGDMYRPQLFAAVAAEDDAGSEKIRKMQNAVEETCVNLVGKEEKKEEKEAVKK